MLFWTIYLFYLVFFIGSGVKGWQLESIALTYLVIVSFALLTWRIINTPFHQNEEALSEVLNMGFWRKSLTLSLMSMATVLFSGLLFA